MTEEVATEFDRAPPSGIQAIQRAGMLMRAVGTQHRHGASLADLCAQTGLLRPTAHRILQALVGERVLRQDRRSKRYFLGSQLYELGLVAAPPMNLRDLCHPHLRALVDSTGETAFLTARAGFDGVCLDRIDGRSRMNAVQMEVGRRHPLSIGGAAVAILSRLPQSEIEQILYTNRDRSFELDPHYSEVDVLSKIRRVREDGYLMSSLSDCGSVKTLSMPIQNADGTPRGAISVAFVGDQSSGLDTSNLRDAMLTAVASLMSDTDRGSLPH